MRARAVFETRAKAQQDSSLKGQTMKRLHVQMSDDDIAREQTSACC